MYTNSKVQTQLSRKLQRFRRFRKNKKCSIFHQLSEYQQNLATFPPLSFNKRFLNNKKVWDSTAKNSSPPTIKNKPKNGHFSISKLEQSLGVPRGSFLNLIFLGVFIFGALIVQIFVDTIKLMTGYQRPYFLSLCNVTLA